MVKVDDRDRALPALRRRRDGELGGHVAGRERLVLVLAGFVRASREVDDECTTRRRDQQLLVLLEETELRGQDIVRIDLGRDEFQVLDSNLIVGARGKRKLADVQSGTCGRDHIPSEIVAALAEERDLAFGARASTQNRGIVAS